MVVLDVFIGLILVYFLYSLLVSILAELFSTWIGMRARILRQGIDNILNDKYPKKHGIKAWLHDIFLIEQREFRYTNAGKFYDEPTIKYLAKVGENKRWSIRNTKPAYIEKNHFVTAIVNLLLLRTIGVNEWDKVKFTIENNTLHLEPETLKMFKGWLTQSNDSFIKFKAYIGNSYMEVNDRLVGWYKRKIGLLLFLLGLLLSFAMNVDTFDIVNILSNNPESRKEMVELAIATSKTEGSEVVEKGTATDSAYYEQVQVAYDSTLTSIEKMQDVLGAGWTFNDEKGLSFYGKLKLMIGASLPWKQKFWGFIITAFALSMGSKFWFDLLKKLVSIRGAGQKPEEHNINKIPTTAEVFIPDDGLTLNTSNPAILALSVNRSKWESQPGFVAANVKFKTNNEPYVELVYDDRDIANMPATVSNPNDPEGPPVKLEYTLGKKGSFGQDPNMALDGALIQSFTKYWGTPSGIVYDKRTGKHVILTCAHVIRNDKTSFIDMTKSEVLFKLPNNDPVSIGNSKNMVLSSFCDAGVVTIKPNLPFKLIGLNKIDNVRAVTVNDEFNTVVNIHTLRKDPNSDAVPLKLKGKIMSSSVAYGFEDPPSSDIRFYDLFMIGAENGDNTKALTLPGDSGSLISDENNNQVGILIGTVLTGGKHFSYGIKLKDVLEILQLDPIKNDQKTIPFV